MRAYIPVIDGENKQAFVVNCDEHIARLSDKLLENGFRFLAKKVTNTEYNFIIRSNDRFYFQRKFHIKNLENTFINVMLDFDFATAMKEKATIDKNSTLQV